MAGRVLPEVPGTPVQNPGTHSRCSSHSHSFNLSRTSTACSKSIRRQRVSTGINAAPTQCSRARKPALKQNLFLAVRGAALFQRSAFSRQARQTRRKQCLRTQAVNLEAAAGTSNLQERAEVKRRNETQSNLAAAGTCLASAQKRHRVEKHPAPNTYRQVPPPPEFLHPPENGSQNAGPSIVNKNGRSIW